MKSDLILKFKQNLFSKVIWSSTFKIQISPRISCPTSVPGSGWLDSSTFSSTFLSVDGTVNVEADPEEASLVPAFWGAADGPGDVNGLAVGLLSRRANRLRRIYKNIPKMAKLLFINWFCNIFLLENMLWISWSKLTWNESLWMSGTKPWITILNFDN